MCGVCSVCLGVCVCVCVHFRVCVCRVFAHASFLVSEMSAPCSLFACGVLCVVLTACMSLGSPMCSVPSLGPVFVFRVGCVVWLVCVFGAPGSQALVCLACVVCCMASVLVVRCAVYVCVACVVGVVPFFPGLPGWTHTATLASSGQVAPHYSRPSAQARGASLYCPSTSALCT